MPTVRPPFHTFFPAPGKAWPPRGGQPRRPRQRLASSKKVTRKAPKACSGVSKKKRPSRQAQPKAQPKAKAKVRISAAAAAAAAEYRFDFRVGVPRLPASVVRRHEGARPWIYTRPQGYNRVWRPCAWGYYHGGRCVLWVCDVLACVTHSIVARLTTYPLSLVPIPCPLSPAPKAASDAVQAYPTQTHVKVYFPDKKKFYDGFLTAFKGGKFFVTYSDGDYEWLRLSPACQPKHAVHDGKCGCCSELAPKLDVFGLCWPGMEAHDAAAVGNFSVECEACGQLFCASCVAKRNRVQESPEGYAKFRNRVRWEGFACPGVCSAIRSARLKKKKAEMQADAKDLAEMKAEVLQKKKRKKKEAAQEEAARKAHNRAVAVQAKIVAKHEAEHAKIVAKQ